jgi:hypothetical protein
MTKDEGGVRGQASGGRNQESGDRRQATGKSRKQKVESGKQESGVRGLGTRWNASLPGERMGRTPAELADTRNGFGIRPRLFAQAHREIQTQLGRQAPIVFTAPAVLIGRRAEADSALEGGRAQCGRTKFEGGREREAGDGGRSQPEDRGRRTEDRGQRTEDGAKSKAESVRTQKQKVESRKLKSGGRSRRATVDPILRAAVAMCYGQNPNGICPAGIGNVVRKYLQVYATVASGSEAGEFRMLDGPRKRSFDFLLESDPQPKFGRFVIRNGVLELRLGFLEDFESHPGNRRSRSANTAAAGRDWAVPPLTAARRASSSSSH